MTTVVALTAVHASLADIAPRHHRAPLLKTFTACPDAPDTCLRLGEMNGGIKSPFCTGRHATLGELPWKPNLFLQV